MENRDSKKLWFKARRYGWGWTPCSIEGWLVTVATAVLLLGGDVAIPMIAADPGEIRWRFGVLQHAPARLGIIAPLLAWNGLIVGAALWICWKTGERPRWRWRN